MILTFVSDSIVFVDEIFYSKNVFKALSGALIDKFRNIYLAKVLNKNFNFSISNVSGHDATKC